MRIIKNEEVVNRAAAKTKTAEEGSKVPIVVGVESDEENRDNLSPVKVVPKV
jgi:hypothetical protein